jgi:hypothetical protein
MDERRRKGKRRWMRDEGRRIKLDGCEAQEEGRKM